MTPQLRADLGVRVEYNNYVQSSENTEEVDLDANPATAHMFIIKPFSAGGISSLFSSHPPTEARVNALLGTI